MWMETRSRSSRTTEASIPTATHMVSVLQTCLTSAPSLVYTPLLKRGAKASGRSTTHEKAELRHGSGQIGYRWTDSFPDPVSSPSRLLDGPGMSVASGSGPEGFEDFILQARCSVCPVLLSPVVLALTRYGDLLCP